MNAPWWLWMLIIGFACYGVYDCTHLSRHRWYRRWKGGKWGLWQTSLPMAAVWLNQWERPGCGEYMIEQEDWS